MTDKPDHHPDVKPDAKALPPPQPADSVIDDPLAIIFDGHGATEGTEPQAGPPKAAAREAGEAAASGSFQVEWFEEDEGIKKGGLFAAPRPEPPPQSFEIIRPAPRTAAGAGAAAGIAPKGRRRGAASPGARARAAAAAGQEARPPLWKRLTWGLMPLLLLLGGYASVVLTQGKVGYGWDEAYYYEPAMKGADWLIDVLRGRPVFGRQAIDAAWGGHPDQPGSLHPEHPDLQKLVSGLAIRMFKDPKDHLYAMRLPMAVFFGLSLTLIYMLGRRAWGTWPGLLAAVLFATMPRVFGHEHFATMEPPLVFMTLLTVYCWLRGLASAAWAAAAGVACGLLFATKINGFFLPIPLVLWSHLYARKQYVNNLFAMLVLGPIAMLAAWPWLWPSPVERLLEYFYFHAQHQQTALYFHGIKWGYGAPNAPWTYPLTIVGVTLPLATLALVAFGAAKTLLKTPRRPHAALFLAIVVMLLGVASAPSTPKYDGERLFLSIYPFLALLGGSTLASITTRLERLARDRGFRGAATQYGPIRWACVGTIALALANGLWACWGSYPFMLSYFNPIVGGTRGAATRGYEVAYWGDALNEDAIVRLNALPDGSKIMPLALHELCLNQFQDWGLLKPTLKIGGQPPCDYHLLQMRRGFFGGPEKCLADGGRFKPIAEWGPPGVPLLALYKTGPEFEAYRAQMRAQGIF